MKNIFTTLIVLLFVCANLLFAKETVGLLDENLPADFPIFKVDSLDNPSPGYMFYSLVKFNQKTTLGTYNVILDQDGKVYKYKSTKMGGADFRMHSNGQYSYGGYVNTWVATSTEKPAYEYIVDKELNKVDSVQCANGFYVDTHEFSILPNGHYLMMAVDQITMDLSDKFAGASPSATIVGSVFQELDANKKVLFQWRSLDHIPLGDFIPSATPFGSRVNSYDHAHGNSCFQDWDGNFMFSFFSSQEIVKVSRQTGEIIWRWGGAHNQFTFINDNDVDAPNYFSYQHNIQRLPNGHILMFDNGRGKKNQYSRIAEYVLDEVNMTSTLVWEYRHTPDIYCGWAGSVNRMPNGNTCVGWGFINSGPYLTTTEVTPDKKVVFEMDLSTDVSSYRTAKYAKLTCDVVAEDTKYELMEGNTYKFNTNTDTTGIIMEFERLTGPIYNLLTVKEFDCSPINCDFDGTASMIYPMRFEMNANNFESFKANMTIDAKYLSWIKNPEKAVVYFRNTIGEGKFAPINTEYDAVSKSLSVTVYSFGEFVIGVPFVPEKPVKPNLIYPPDNAKVDFTKLPTLNWALLGYARNADLQVATDADFGNIVINESNLTTALYKTTTLEKDKTYYWHTRANNEAGSGSWSDTWSFTPMEPYIKLINPNGGETLIKDSSVYIIRWDKNTSDMVKIELIKNGVSVGTVRDSLKTTTNAYAWIIPNKYPEDSVYKIRITNVTNSALVAESDNVFTIKEEDTSLDDTNLSNFNFEIAPNPATNQITISLNNELQSFGQEISISIFDSRGIEIKRFIGNEVLGQNAINFDTQKLASGIYYCALSSGGQTITKSFVVVR